MKSAALHRSEWLPNTRQLGLKLDDVVNRTLIFIVIKKFKLNGTWGIKFGVCGCCIKALQRKKCTIDRSFI